MKSLLMALALALVWAGAARADRLLTLPSPVTPLSTEPPLAGGATVSKENVHHRIVATSVVRVSIDRGGTPFAVSATQRLDLRVVGDYFITIGAPLRNVVAGTGSASAPGFRPGTIIWAGFNPGRRVLVADATLAAGPAARGLPLQVRPAAGGVVLQNVTGVNADALTAAAAPGPVLVYLRQLASAVTQGEVPVLGTIPVTSHPHRVRVHVVAPLHVTGRIGSRHVDLVLTGRKTIAARGKIDLQVVPFVQVKPSGLVSDAIRASLTVARVRQYSSYLGNPDLSGTSRTTFVYRTTARPVVRTTAAPASHASSWATDLLIAAGIAAAVVAGAFVWARS